VGIIALHNRRPQATTTSLLVFRSHSMNREDISEKQEFVQDQPEVCSGDLVVGQLIGTQYHIDAKLGSGGMGAVYRCTDKVTARTVAVKVLASQRAISKLIIRFQTEAKAIARLEHPNIVKLYSMSVDDAGVPYIVMEYVDGVPLSELISRDGVLAQEKVYEIATQLCDALQYAHSIGVVHRDLKPSNIIVKVRYDGSHVVKTVSEIGTLTPVSLPMM